MLTVHYFGLLWVAHPALTAVDGMRCRGRWISRTRVSSFIDSAHAQLLLLHLICSHVRNHFSLPVVMCTFCVMYRQGPLFICYGQWMRLHERLDQLSRNVLELCRHAVLRKPLLAAAVARCEGVEQVRFNVVGRGVPNSPPSGSCECVV